MAAETKSSSSPKFKPSVCPDCGEEMKDEFVPCGLQGAGDESELLKKYDELVKQGKLTPAQ